MNARRAFALALGLSFVAPAALAQAVVPPLYTTPVASNLNDPLFVTASPGDNSRLFVVEQRGKIKVIENGVMQSTPFLDLSALVGQTGNEQGLLGLAFDPNYATNHNFYVNYTDRSGDTRVARYQASSNPNVALTTESRLLYIDQPYSNHNGGWIGFGPDNYLYVASGDGGSGNDPQNRAQNLNSLLGKMLRIDVNRDDFPTDAARNYGIPAGNPFVGAAGADEIWDYGLRNPWRNSFDRATGDLYIGDVGQGEREEISFHANGAAGGINFGWRIFEGTLPTGIDPDTINQSPPIHEYTHNDGYSVTGGYVYRGDAIEGLSGTYLFGDYGSGRIWSFRYDGATKSDFRELTSELGEIGSIASFGEDANGELYAVSLSGSVYRIDGRLLGDATGDRQIDGADYTVWADNFHGSGGFDSGDFNRDGAIDGADYTIWADRFQPGSAVVPIPEPPAAHLAWLAASAGGLALWWRRRRGLASG
jgi:glucose/arabinose dehydrogenase